MRALTPARLLLALLAAAASFVSASDEGQVGPIGKDCCPKGKFCCGSGCLDDSLAPIVRCARPTCCDPTPDPEPKPVDDCCLKGEFCCAGECLDDSQQPLVKCRRDGCCKPDDGDDDEDDEGPGDDPDPEDEKEKCCAEKDRVCCDGACFPPETRFIRACDSNLCGCPDEEEPEPLPKPLPKPLPTPLPKPLPVDKCCGAGKTCCGRKCINLWLQPFLKCIQIAGGCC